MRTVLLLCAAVATLGAPLSAQSFSTAAGTVPAPDPNIPLYFEAASVKPSNATNPGMGIRRQPGGRFDTTNTPVKILITGSGRGSDHRSHSAAKSGLS
jgi:hypothetical protein